MALSIENIRSRTRVKRFNRAGKVLAVLCSFPKSGSQHLQELLARHVPGLAVHKPKYAGGWGNNFISAERLLAALDPRGEHLVYGHFPRTQDTENLLCRFDDWRLVLLLRPLPDVLVSYREHVERKTWGPLDYRIEGFSEAVPGFDRMSVGERNDYLIRFLLPWYLKFLVSWIGCELRAPIKLVTFEQQTAHPVETLEEITRFLGFELDRAALAASGARLRPFNFNKGVPGRGRGELGAAQLDRIRELVDTFGILRGTSLGEYLTEGFGREGFTLSDLMAAGEEHPLLGTADREARP